MDPRIRKRMMLFYVFGILNVFLALYILIEGRAHAETGTVTKLVILCLVFAAVNFYVPYAIKKKHEQDAARSRGAQGDQGGTRK